MTPLWYFIVTLCVVVGIINLGLAYIRRGVPMAALARSLAGIVSIVVAVGIVAAKAAAFRQHPSFEPRDIIIGFGVFTFAVLVLPTYFERGVKTNAPTIQQRAARPANATIRLRDARGGGGSSDEWVN
ncbi:MAG TPA: hypothetical protein VFU88_00555 [Ktedonobacterales bacterium]|nr:hypothetical protein [Ktedonobacterales bacterium]